MIGRARTVFALAIACGAAASAHQAARDAARAPAGTASIAGVVVMAGADTLPARRVRVTLNELSGRAPGRTTTTDDRGVFAFTGLPAGRFELQAFKNAYLRASYGASRPERTGTPIVLRDGETVTNLSMTSARGGVITGVVLNSHGRPLPGLTVRVLKLGYDATSGEPTLNAPGTGSAGVTDDRGEYRAYGLPPGGYLVLVPPPSALGRSSAPIRQLTTDEVEQALRAAQASRPGAPPASLASSPTQVNYAPVFYPSATDIRAAAAITLGLSEERTGVDIMMELVPVATISGTITAPSGALPAFLSIRLVPAGDRPGMLAGAGLRGLSALPSADGKYTFAGISPGSYTITAAAGGGRGAPSNGPAVWAAADVNVNGQDVEVPLTLQPGVAVNGHVVFEGPAPTPAELQALSFALVAPGSGGAVPRWGGSHVDAAGRFDFAGVPPGTYRFATTWNDSSARQRWTVKSSAANGRDAFESPHRHKPGETLDWSVTFTDKPTGVTGVLTDPGGRPATDYYVLVFASDRRYWTPGSRRVRMTRPGTDGSYSLTGLPPGEYYLATPADLEDGEWNDPALLEQLVPSAAKVRVTEAGLTKQDFRIGGA
jgi:hypothetical protein